MRKVLLAAVTVVTVLPFVVAGFVSQSSAKGAPSKLVNRFGPSGAVSVDPRNAVPLSSLPAHIQAAAIPPSSTGTGGCSDSSATNVRANQECTNQSAAGFFGRGQSQNETGVAVNPTNPNNVLISQNDYREGDGACGVDWSLDGGKHFGSQKVDVNFARPILNNGGFRHYWTSSGDTSVAFDSSGEAYVMCQVFDRPFGTDERGVTPGGNGVADASAFLIFRSADGGASWSFPGNYVVTSVGVEGPGSTVGLLDKEYMTIDNSGGTNDGRIYVTWSNYSTNFASDPIMVSYSDDHGVTWTTPADISGFSKALCPINYSGATAGNCDANQFSDPVVGSDGTAYVVFANFNNCYGAFGPPCHGSSNDNHNQFLFVKSSDGVNWTSPVKVSDYYDLPDCFTYTGQDAGRACVPTMPLSGNSVFRAANYPSIAVMSDNRIVVDFGSYINAHSNPDIKGNCSAAGLSPFGLDLYNGVGAPGGCNNDIVRSTSDDGGLTFTGTNTKVEKLITVSHDTKVSDQWFQWTTSFQNKAVTMFYDRRYGNDESNGNMDITLVSTNSGLDPQAVGVPIRVTDASMPPSNEFPGTNGFSVFMGDYSGIAVGSDGVAHPAWEDTRNPIFTFDETSDARVLTAAGFGGDIYTAAVKISTST